MYNTNNSAATTAMQFQQTHHYVFPQQSSQQQPYPQQPHNKVSMTNTGFPSPVQDDTPPIKTAYNRYPHEQHSQQQINAHQVQQHYEVTNFDSSTSIHVPEPITINFANSNYDSASDSASFLSPTTSPTSVEDEILQRNMQQILDKKRRRRESHNAVERRRRDNINDRINELATLLPDRDAAKLSKGSILRNSVDHIKLLHDNLRQHQRRIQELENMLDMYRMTSQQQELSHPPNLTRLASGDSNNAYH